MAAKSWFRSLWITPRKHEVNSEKVPIGVLAFEVASLMSKLVQMWHSLNDEQVVKLREEIMSSEGIKKLVSDDDNYIASLICSELIENLANVARAVARLSDKCTDPFLKSFKAAFDDLIKYGVDPYGWLFTWKKMDSKVKKMEQYIDASANLYQEMETLEKLEQTLKRMKGNSDLNSVPDAYDKKVVRKQQEVKHLKELSLWNRTYNYIVDFLTRSLFTTFSRIRHVFGLDHLVDMGFKDSKMLDSVATRHSVTAMVQSSVHPYESNTSSFASGPLSRMTTKSGPIIRTNMSNDLYSGHLGHSRTKSSLISGRHNPSIFYSGALGKPTTKSGTLSNAVKNGLGFWHNYTNSSFLQGRNSCSKANRLTSVVPFKECMMMAGSTSPLRSNQVNCGDASSGMLGGTKRNIEHYISGGLHKCCQSIFSSKHKPMHAPPESLGAAALASHYANVVILIEKLVASPNLIGNDARNDLYNMLPTNVKAALREKLWPCTKGVASSTYDSASLAGEWSDAIAETLEWLAPLAHNMIKWQSEQSYEHQNLVSDTNVLLVQTLYFANQEKTEAAITELLVGLNYMWRFGRELNSKALMECASGRS